MTRAAVEALGLKLFSSSPGAALTAVLPPAGVDSGVVVKELKSRFGAIITNATTAASVAEDSHAMTIVRVTPGSTA